ncbi:hypothetical protein E4634_17265 [Mangrovimicrobium sediminis]|uniref:VPLPA-CTERM sorting domain-containing protein n=1 Tax=Mangrovimicrobium sediminis TaxID=2562682 RepID=A0A4Z0LX51_9GAMM|nr:VPLPA-CTERM sorting domain-containing protein [Haliea sp. SAOS-164]TGD71861.1 hypothetical protein E4634_17265 [Haliea sp. SAOS-164]
MKHSGHIRNTLAAVTLAAGIAAPLSSQAATIYFDDPHPNAPFLDVINITKLGGSGDFEVVIDVVLQETDRVVTLSLDAGESITLYGYFTEFTLSEAGAGWASNVDMFGDPSGTKGYSVMDSNTAVGTCVQGTHCVWDIVVTNVPVPAAAWLFGSAMLGLGSVMRRRQVQTA